MKDREERWLKKEGVVNNSDYFIIDTFVYWPNSAFHRTFQKRTLDFTIYHYCSSLTLFSLNKWMLSQEREEITTPNTFNRQKEIRSAQVEVFVFAGRTICSQWLKTNQGTWTEMQVVVMGICGNDLLSPSLKWESLAETHWAREVEHTTKITTSSRTK